MILPGDFVGGDGIPACTRPVNFDDDDDDKYLGWHLEPGEVALVIYVVTVDKPVALPAASRQWALCLARGRVGWFLVAALEVQTSPGG